MSSFHTLHIANIRRETSASVSLGLAVPEALRERFAFRPGQYLTLRVMIDGEDVRRSYSICSGLDEEGLRVGIKKVEGGVFSTFANELLQEGDAIDVMPPQGRFTVDLNKRGQHILAIAAGSGITPILSIAKSLLARDPNARLTLIYGNRNSASVMFAEVLEDLKNRHLGRFSLIHMLSRESQDVAALSGRIDGARLKALAQGLIDMQSVDEAYLCGPEAMITDVRAALATLGLPAERIHSELFSTDTPRRERVPVQAEQARKVLARVTIHLDGKSNAFDMLAGDENIVDAAARAGLDLPYSCKGGMCCTCRCRVIEGKANMAINYSLEDWELKAGFTLACQSRPTTPEIVLDFDQL